MSRGFATNQESQPRRGERLPLGRYRATDFFVPAGAESRLGTASHGSRRGLLTTAPPSFGARALAARFRFYKALETSMTNRRFYPCWFVSRLARVLAGLALVSLASLAAEAASLPRPNILLILADDLKFPDLGSYGSEIPTPNLDALATRGLRFTQFYNAARCCPTRAALLTGLYPHQAGVGHMLQNWSHIAPAYSSGLNNRCVTFAESL